MQGTSTPYEQRQAQEAHERAEQRRIMRDEDDPHAGGPAFPLGRCCPTIHNGVQESWFTREKRFAYYVFTGTAGAPYMGIYLDW